METLPSLVARQLAQWANDLIDVRASDLFITLRADPNRLLELVQPPAARLLAQLSDPRGAPLRLAPSAPVDAAGVAVARAASGQTVPQALRAMQAEQRTEQLAHGVHVLFAAFGALIWTTQKGDAARSPLLLIPVCLERASRLHGYVLEPLDPDAAPIFNPALAIKLVEDYGLTLRVPEPAGGALAFDDAVEALRQQIAPQPAWRIEETAYLGIFDFSKYALYEDLKAHEDEFAERLLVRALARDPAAVLPHVAGRAAAELDNDDPATVFQVLDADSSQRVAIDLVNQGGSIVVEGPPGTGKSQTIANLIAESLARDKTVLFVSEKMAALAVVAKRLETARLGPFFLALHDESVSENAIVKELAGEMERLTAEPAGAGNGADSAQFTRLAAVRHELNAYLGALCDSRNALQRSAYDVMGEIANLAGAPEIRFDYQPEAMGGLTPELVERLHQAIDELRQHERTVLDPGANPWRLAAVTDDQRAWDERYKLRETLASLASAAEALDAAQDDVRRTWGLRPGPALRDAQWLVDLFADCANRNPAGALPQWFAKPAFDAAAAGAGAHADGQGDDGRRRAALLGAYSAAVFDPTILGPILDEMQHDLNVMPVDARFGTSAAPQPQVSVRIAAGILRGELTELDRLAAALAGQLGMRPPVSMREIAALADLAALVASGRSPLRAWFAPGQSAALKALAAEAGAHAAALATRSDLLARYRPAIFDYARDDVIARVEAAAADPLSRVAGLFRGDIWRQEKLELSHDDLTHQEALADLRAARAVRLADAWFADHGAELDAAFAHHYSGPGSDWSAIGAALNIVDGARALIDADDPPAALVDFPPRFGHGGLPAAAVTSALVKTRAAWGMLAGVLPHDDPWRQTNAGDLTLVKLMTALEIRLRASAEMTEPTRRLALARLTAWTSFKALTADLREAAALNEIDGALRSQFGHFYRGQNATNWAEISYALGWVGQVRQRFLAAGDPPGAFAAHCCDAPAGSASAARTTLAEAIARVRELGARLAVFFTAAAPVIRDGIETWPLAELAAWARTKEHDLPGLDRWLSYLQATANAEALGLGSFIAAIRAARLAPEQWRDAFDLQLLTLWLTWREQQAPELLNFTQRGFDAKQAEFAGLDRWQVEAAVRRLTAKLTARRARAAATEDWNRQLAELRQEVYASGARRPLRQLFKAMPTVLQFLKPCMLMSPLAVARYLGEAKILFDVVVFDEASQIAPAEAIGSVARGNQIVVVGDSKQLPPTGFFETKRTDASSNLARAESLLHLANMAGLPRRPLTWHYRSQDEQLISFSNRHFYDNSLVTFPSPRLDLDSVEFIHVSDGVYARGGERSNVVEARRLAAVLVAELRANPDASLGVITFSEAQMAAVRDEIDKLRLTEPVLGRLRPEHEPEGFFVRNLENVQGDERDIILFSVGYGPDESGVMASNFGPLNLDGGERRLNVAVTRARARIILLASFQPERLGASTNPGVALLREYLVFARETPDTRRNRTPAEVTPPKALAASVAAALRRAGFSLETDVGESGFRIDIAVKENPEANRFLLAIECDGAAYAAANSARDRDRLRAEVLTRTGWRVHRVWANAWLNDRDGEIDRIKDALEYARAAAAPPVVPVAPPPVVPIVPPPPVVPTTPPVIETGEAEPQGGEVATAVPITGENGFEIDLAGGDGTGPDAATTAPVAALPKEPPPKPKRRKPPAPPRVEPEPDANRKQTEPIGDATWLPAGVAERLRAAGIRTIDELIAQAHDLPRRRALAKTLGAPVADVGAWVNRADLMRIKGIGPELANLLAEAEVNSCRDLRRRVARNLHARLAEINTARAITGRTPTLAEIERWIAEAKTLAAD